MRLTIIDWLVIGAYFALNIGIGFYYKARAGLECRPTEGQRPHTVKDDPQPQPPVAFGFSKVNPDSWKLLL